MKPVIYALIVCAVVVLQIAFFGHLRPLGVIPDLALIMVVFVGLWEDASPTLVIAIATGLLLDMISGSDFGLHTGLLVVTALSIIAFRQFGFHTESVVGAVVMVALGTMVTNVAVIASLGGGALIEWGTVMSRIVAQLILNGLLVVAIFAVRAAVGDRRGRVSSELKRGSWI